MAAVCLAAVSSGAFTRFETHELIESGDLTRDRRPGEGGSPISRLAADRWQGSLADGIQHDESGYFLGSP